MEKESSSTSKGNGAVRRAKQKSGRSFFEEFGRYFVHGLAFSVLTFISLFILVPAGLLAVVLAAFAGIIAWFALVLLAYGFANAVICSYLWHFHVRGDWPSLILHGLCLAIANIIISLIFETITSNLLIGNDIVRIILIYSVVLIGTSILNGLAAKQIGENFRLGRGLEMPKKHRKKDIFLPPPCPSCGAIMPYEEYEIGPDGTAPCRKCGARIRDQHYAPRASHTHG